MREKPEFRTFPWTYLLNFLSLSNSVERMNRAIDATADREQLQELPSVVACLAEPTGRNGLGMRRHDKRP